MLQHIGDAIDYTGDTEEQCVLDAVRVAPSLTHSRVLLVGEHNPYGADLSNQLVCWPEDCAGHRLQSNILGIPDAEYLALWRTNLCGGRGWIMADARARATELTTGIPPWTTIVLLGRKVATAFGLADMPPLRRRESGHFHMITLPHPSGRCREWYKPGAIVAARSLLRWYVPEVLWGSL